MKHGQLIDTVMDHMFKKYFAQYEWFNPKSRPFLIYPPELMKNQIWQVGLFYFKGVYWGN